MSALMLAPADADICPACLTLLPDGYQFDHVAVDRAISGDRTIFAAMTEPEKVDVVVTALSRGFTVSRLAKTLSWPYVRIQQLVPAGHPCSIAEKTARDEQKIRELWEKGLRDVDISAATGINPTQIGRTRKKLGLATRRSGFHRTGARR